MYFDILNYLFLYFYTIKNPRKMYYKSKIYFPCKGIRFVHARVSNLSMQGCHICPCKGIKFNKKSHVNRCQILTAFLRKKFAQNVGHVILEGVPPPPLPPRGKCL